MGPGCYGNRLSHLRSNPVALVHAILFPPHPPRLNEVTVVTRQWKNKLISDHVILNMLRRFLFVLPICATLFAQAPPARQFLLQIEPVRADFALSNVTAEEIPVLQAHGAYLRELLAAGKLVYAGQAFQPKRLFGLIVVEAPDAAAAQAILDADPAVKNKVFRGEVIPYRTVIQRQPAEPKTN